MGAPWPGGWNAFGQLGDGTTIDRPRPVAVPGVQAIESVAGGVGHSLALGQDGSVWTWGLNNFGQLSRPTAVVSAVPARVAGLAGVVTVGAGGHHSLVAGADGTMTSWGWNESGQLGGTLLQGVRAVAGGYAHTVAGAS